MDSIKELSFFLMLIRTIIETGLFVVFRPRCLSFLELLFYIRFFEESFPRTIRYPEKSLLIVPKLPPITLLSLGLSQMFVPAIIRLLFDLKGKSEVKKMQEMENPDQNSGKIRQEKKSKPCSKICFGTLNGVTRFVVLGGYFFKWRLDSYFSRKTGKRYRPNSFCNIKFSKFVEHNALNLRSWKNLNAVQICWILH